MIDLKRNYFRLFAALCLLLISWAFLGNASQEDPDQEQVYGDDYNPLTKEELEEMIKKDLARLKGIKGLLDVYKPHIVALENALRIWIQHRRPDMIYQTEARIRQRVMEHTYLKAVYEKTHENLEESKRQLAHIDEGFEEQEARANEPDEEAFSEEEEKLKHEEPVHVPGAGHETPTATHEPASEHASPAHGTPMAPPPAHGPASLKLSELPFNELLKMAETGNLKAQYNLGARYYQGKGVLKNLEAAKEWFQKAAAQGFEPAKEALRKLAETPQINKAKPLFDEVFSKAKKNNGQAQYELGIMYMKGEGVAKNLDEAKKWLEEARYNNIVPANAALEQLGVIERENLQHSQGASSPSHAATPAPTTTHEASAGSLPAEGYVGTVEVADPERGAIIGSIKSANNVEKAFDRDFAVIPADKLHREPVKVGDKIAFSTIKKNLFVFDKANRENSYMIQTYSKL